MFVHHFRPVSGIARSCAFDNKAGPFSRKCVVLFSFGTIRSIAVSPSCRSLLQSVHANIVQRSFFSTWWPTGESNHGKLEMIPHRLNPSVTPSNFSTFQSARGSCWETAKLSGMAQSNLTCKIGPSILNADLSNLHSECDRLLNSGADYLHLDVMDGSFVPNLTFGHPVVRCLRKRIPAAFFDMHMMVAQPEKWIKPMSDAGATQYTFHLEATSEPMDVIRKIREEGMKVGIGIKPTTAVEEVLPYVDHVDMVLVMTVEPGFGGQSFMVDMMSKVQFLRSQFKELDIEVDGGVGPNTISMCAEAGANMIVSGTAVTGSDNPRQVISFMRQTVEEAIQKSELER